MAEKPILVVGEFPEDTDVKMGIPFLGRNGLEFKRILKDAGIAEKDCRFTNVFPDIPPDKKVENWCGKKADVGPVAGSRLPLRQGQYFFEERLQYLERLAATTRETKPKLIIALGNVACWALLNRTGILSLRGNVFPCELVPGVPVLPTYSPSYVQAVWSERVVVVADMMKAKRAAEGGLQQRERWLLLEPTLEETLEGLTCLHFADQLSVDIETKAGTITCIGFAASADAAITVPFWDPRKSDGNYWQDLDTEKKVWYGVKSLCESPVPKLFQNGLYDIQYLVKDGIRPARVLDDTMILHHSIYPEMEKGLGFMGSVYTDEAPWKLLRRRNKENFKADE